MASSMMMRSAAFLSGSRLTCRAPFRPAVVVAAPGPATTVARRPVVEVNAMADAKKKQRTDSAVKRAMLGAERRLYNKARKSACATRIKKVLKSAQTFLAQPPATEADIKPLEKLIAEAYQEIDKAVTKKVLHINNAARKKSRIARYKRLVLMSAGLFTPSEDHPEYKRFLKLKVKKAA